MKQVTVYILICYNLKQGTNRKRTLKLTLSPNKINFSHGDVGFVLHHYHCKFPTLSFYIYAKFYSQVQWSIKNQLRTVNLVSNRYAYNSVTLAVLISIKRCIDQPTLLNKNINKKINMFPYPN